jgi:hypothetical protein
MARDEAVAKEIIAEFGKAWLAGYERAKKQAAALLVLRETEHPYSPDWNRDCGCHVCRTAQQILNMDPEDKP